MKTNGISAPIGKAYLLLIQLGSCILQPLLLLVFRVYWGWLLYHTGMGKLLNHNNTAQFFSSLGIPFPELNAWFVAGLECVGGLLLLVGFCSRPIALLMTGNMIVAYLSMQEDREKVLNILSDPEPFLAADPFFFLLMAVMVLAFGPGKLSIDALLKRRCRCVGSGSCQPPQS